MFEHPPTFSPISPCHAEWTTIDIDCHCRILFSCGATPIGHFHTILVQHPEAPMPLIKGYFHILDTEGVCEQRVWYSAGNSLENGRCELLKRKVRIGIAPPGHKVCAPSGLCCLTRNRKRLFPYTLSFSFRQHRGGSLDRSFLDMDGQPPEWLFGLLTLKLEDLILSHLSLCSWAEVLAI